MAKQCKIGDVVVINGIKARIEENNDGNCEQCRKICPQAYVLRRVASSEIALTLTGSAR